MSDAEAQSIRVLLVEDSDDDALLVTRELRRGGYTVFTDRVDRRESLDEALDRDRWDVVILDYNIPGFGAEEALAMVRRTDLDLPVIIVSGSIGEDLAVASMKSGAQDYLMKGNLTRLVPAVEREVREAENRRAHRRAEETIRHMAFHDSLTGLVNRYEFEQRLRAALDASRESGEGHALLYLDLDQFKLVNDTCGHVAGDELLRQLAVVLHGNTRDSDTLARLGGDEFGMLLHRCPLPRAQEIAEQLLRQLNEFRFVWSSKVFSIGGSIGLVPVGAGSASLEGVMRAADIACYAAKENGRNRVQVYHEDDADLSRRHGEMEWVARLRQALDEDRFLLFRQAIVPMPGNATRQPHNEFLLRLRERDGEIVPPGAFIPAAERFNLMSDLDRWVIREALEHVAHLNRDGARDPGIYFINLSGMSLGDDALFQYISGLLSALEVRPQQVCFEITETAAIANLGRAVEFVHDIRLLGCRFALDDFGSGLSSFSYLQTLPVDFLKIDGSFVQDIAHVPLDRAIVEAIEHVGHAIDLRIIAEWVENQEVMSILERIGVDFAQGYHLHRPEPI